MGVARGMNWRAVLTAGAAGRRARCRGWSVWRQHAEHGVAAATGGRSDYVLHDFELVALDGTTGKEAFTLRAPLCSAIPATARCR